MAGPARGPCRNRRADPAVPNCRGIGRSPRPAAASATARVAHSRRRGGRRAGVLRKAHWQDCDRSSDPWLDEVPQLVNVLRGEMNLIGPRPHPISNQQIFMDHIAYYGLRSTVHPGVTGWAQIRYGYANNLEQETEKMRYDLYYIKNRTLWLDIRILLETIFIILTGHGAH